MKYALVGVAVWVVLLACSSVGVQSWFSPDTLEGRCQAIHLVWGIQLPVFCSPVSPRDYRLVDFLVSEGYWRPRVVEHPRWFFLSHQNPQWRDGVFDLYKQFTWRADDWIAWTKENPRTAECFWPYLLEVMRSKKLGADNREWVVPTLFVYARLTETTDELREIISTHSELEEVRSRLPVFPEKTD